MTHLRSTSFRRSVDGDRYVRTDGRDQDNNCTQLTDPCATVTQAVEQASAGDRILVARGTYVDNNILINKRVNILGDYDGAFQRQILNGQEVVDPSRTIIDAQNSGRILHIKGSSSLRPIIEGFTFKNGQFATSGGAIYIENSPVPSLTKIIILDSSSNSNGGGIYIEGGQPILEEVTISNTVASGNGGGIYVEGGQFVISQTRLSSNTATNGGGLYNKGGNLTLWNHFIYSNTTTSGGGGGIYNRGILNLINDTLYGNQAATFGRSVS